VRALRNSYHPQNMLDSRLDRSVLLIQISNLLSKESSRSWRLEGLKYAAVWLFLLGKAADKVLTFIGLSMGLTEMNKWEGTTFGLLMVFTAAGMIFTMDWLIERYKLNKWWWVPYCVAGMEWFAVPWNLIAINTVY
jgi:hypothetical protein